jgi:hypothetical protein
MKRFGRNQRRRAREAIAALQQQQAQTLDKLAATQSDLFKANDFARQVAEVVGREAIIAGEPVELDYQYQRRERRLDSIRHWPYKPVPAFWPWQEVANAPIEWVRAETLHLLDIQLIADVLRHQMHAMVTIADEDAAYAISGSALRRMSAREIEASIAPHIARMLAARLKARFPHA